MKNTIQILTFPTYSLHSPRTYSYSWGPCTVAWTGGLLLIQQYYHPELVIQFSLQHFHLFWLFWPVAVICLAMATEALQSCFWPTWLRRKSGSMSPVHLGFCMSRTLQWAVCEWSVGQLKTADEWGAEHRARLQPRNMPLWVYGCKPLRCSQVKQQTQCLLPACLLQVILKICFLSRYCGHLRYPESVWLQLLSATV